MQISVGDWGFLLRIDTIETLHLNVEMFYLLYSMIEMMNTKHQLTVILEMTTAVFQLAVSTQNPGRFIGEPSRE